MYNMSEIEATIEAPIEDTEEVIEETEPIIDLLGINIIKTIMKIIKKNLLKNKKLK